VTWAPLVLSFQIAIIATVIATVLGIAIGVGLANPRVWGRNLLDAILTAPMVMPPTVLGYYLLVALGRHSVIGRAYESLFGSSIVFTRTGAVVAAVVGALPLIVKSSRAALEGVNPTLLRAARTLGAGPWRAFFTVHLPLAAPGIVAGVVLGFARSLGDFGVTLMIAGDVPGETQTASLAIYDAIQANREGEAIGMIVVLTSLVIAALFLFNKLAATKHVA
jgi:molybdate transport system permease protein